MVAWTREKQAEEDCKIRWNAKIIANRVLSAINEKIESEKEKE